LRAKTVCAQAGCGNTASYRGRCAQHARRISRRPWARTVATVVKRDRGICGICGQPGATSADHIRRVRDGGSDEPSNLRAAHVDCNRRRG
jgi:5-methylcytosine-specific restriction endonuclease McrA